MTHPTPPVELTYTLARREMLTHDGEPAFTLVHRATAMRYTVSVIETLLAVDGSILVGWRGNDYLRRHHRLLGGVHTALTEHVAALYGDSTWISVPDEMTYRVIIYGHRRTSPDHAEAHRWRSSSNTSNIRRDHDKYGGDSSRP